MLKHHTFLAIIPARGGSKRLPRKNTLNLAGKPLITWTIEAALGSKYIDKVVVSSDDDEILAIARQYHVKTIKRPVNLAHDTATTFDAIKHAIEHAGKTYDYIVLLQPTSPLRTTTHIDEAIELLESRHANAVISVTEVEHSPLWSNVLPSDGSMSGFLKEEVLNQRSQDLPTFYRLNGAIYICHTNKLLATGSFFTKDRIYAYKMAQKFSVDIDEELDFKFAATLLANP